MSSANDQMLEMFLFESSELIEHLDEILLASEKNQSLTEDDVNEVFRIMHTIKGSSAMMDYRVISTVTHRLEDCFFIIRDQGIDQSHFTQLFDLMLDATDFLKNQLEAIQSGGQLAEGNDQLIERAESFYHLLKGDVAADNEMKDVDDGKASQPESTGANHTYQVDVLFEEDCGMENLRSFMLVNTLKNHCDILGYQPEDIETNPETAHEILLNGFSLLVRTGLDLDALQQVVEGSMHVKSAVITLIDSETPSWKPEAGGGKKYHVDVLFEEDCGMENLRSFMLINTLRAHCNVLEFDPPDIETNPATASVIHNNGFQIGLETTLSQKDLQSLVDHAMHVRSARLTPMESAVKPVPAADPGSVQEAPSASKTPATAKPVETPAASPPGKAPTKKVSAPIKQDLINVSLAKLDELMDLMGELVITESMVTRSPDLKGISSLDNFHKSARQLRKLTDELQDMVMSIRMVPVAGTFQKMQRIVRDMCRNLGKEAELVTMGEETDIDKTIIDGISDPIMHLVRNAMDHGVELPHEREAAGKPRKATVTLSAQNTGGEILVTVSDDGKGLDAEKLLEKAKENGLLTKPVQDYTDKEAFQLLMLPGFSTREQVTEYSGRGVGMDVVKKNIEKIGGSVQIESKKGRGMSVFLKIPLTLAIVDGMDVSVGGGTYTLQITSISESFKPTSDQVIVDTEGHEMILIRGEVYPIIRLHELYDVPGAITEITEGILILVQAGDRTACLFVDQLIGEQQMVVKPLPKYLSLYDVKSWGISGCTILGDGSISLILDVGGIIDKVMEKR